MATSINVHMNLQPKHKGAIKFEAALDEWPMTLRMSYIDGGDTISGNHETTVFIDELSAAEVRKTATSAMEMTDALFARANYLDAKEADNG